MPDASTQTTKGKNIFLLPKKKEEEPICCVGCGKDGVYPEDHYGDTMCPSCFEDEDEDEMKEICIFEAWDRKYGANVAEKDKETEFQKKRHLFSDAYDKQEEEEKEVIYYFLKDNELTQTDTPFNPKIHEWETLLEVDGRIEKTYKLKGTDEGGNCDEEEEDIDADGCDIIWCADCGAWGGCAKKKKIFVIKSA